MHIGDDEGREVKKKNDNSDGDDNHKDDDCKDDGKCDEEKRGDDGGNDKGEDDDDDDRDGKGKVKEKQPNDGPKDTKVTQPDKGLCCDFGFLLHESKKVIASKDSQIEQLEHYVNRKEGQISQLEDSNRIKEQQIAKLEELNRALIQKVENVIPDLAKKTDEALTQVKVQSDKLLLAVDEKISNLSKNCENVSEEKIDRLSHAVEKIDTFEKQQPLSREETQKWQTECQSLMLVMAQKMEGIEKQIVTDAKEPIANEENEKSNDVNQGDESGEIIIVADSNGKFLVPELLHHKKKVTIERRSTLERATSHLPTRSNPEKVTDVVLMTGLNDSRDVQTSVETVVKRQKQACDKYREHFENAKIHIAAKAPYNPKQRNLNRQLEEYANNSGIPFIDHGLTDRDTGHIRSEMLDGVHYTKHSIKTVAGRIKRSLYADEQAANKKNHIQRRPSESQRKVETRNAAPAGNESNHPAAALMSAITSFFNKAELTLPVSPAADAPPTHRA